MKTITTSTRTFKNHRRDGLFCPCGQPATTSCTDAHQITMDGNEGWAESKPRYGCPAHPVESKVYLHGGIAMTASDYEKLNSYQNN